MLRKYAFNNSLNELQVIFSLQNIMHIVKQKHKAFESTCILCSFFVYKFKL